MYNSIEQIKVFYPLQIWENNEILRRKSEKVDIFDNEIQEFAEILLDLMYAYDWVGLAAPQVGKNIRIIATTQWKEVKKWQKEACLSVPWLCGDVERWTRIVVKYQDKKWKLHTQKYTWFSAIVIQHEMDHLEWILFTDKTIGKIRKINDKSEY